MKSLRELGYVFEIYFYEYGSFSDLDSSDFNAPGILVRGGCFQNYSLDPWYVDTGIYAVVRHPLYLGWLLIYVVLILLSRYWLTAIIGIPGMICVYLISRQEDQHLIEKFGDDYKDYMQKVPRMNLLVGIIRLVRRRDRG